MNKIEGFMKLVFKNNQIFEFLQIYKLNEYLFLLKVQKYIFNWEN